MKESISYVYYIILYLIKAVILLIGKGLVYLLAPVVSLPIFIRKGKEKDIIGVFSPRENIQHIDREFLIEPLMWMQTHDAPLDEYTLGGYGNIKSKYINRIMWLWRNSAYSLAEFLGIEKTGIKITKNRLKGLYGTPKTGYEYLLFENANGYKGFMLRGQIKIYRDKFLEFRFGYGYDRPSPIRNKGMLYVRFMKIRTYKSE